MLPPHPAVRVISRPLLKSKKRDSLDKSTLGFFITSNQ